MLPYGAIERVLSPHPYPLPEERENPRRFVFFDAGAANAALGFSKNGGMILPLPALPFPSPLTPLPSDGRGEPRGEGRGEGKK